MMYMHYIQTENGSESDPHSYEAPTVRITSTSNNNNNNNNNNIPIKSGHYTNYLIKIKELAET